MVLFDSFNMTNSDSIQNKVWITLEHHKKRNLEAEGARHRMDNLVSHLYLSLLYSEFKKSKIEPKN